MMKKLLILGILFLLIFITGCSNGHNTDINKADNSYKKVEKKSLPTKIFDNKTTNSQLSEQEIKDSIKLYLNSDDDLSKAKEYYQDKLDSEEKLSEVDSKEIKQLNKLTRENDNNFYNYIKNNRLSEGYNKYAFKISKYISTSNKVFENLDKQIDLTMNKLTENGEIPTEDFDEIKYDSKIVNGKEQDKIEKFLKEKNIKTRAFKNTE